MTDRPVGTEDARERALAAWWDVLSVNGEQGPEPYSDCFRAGYDAARADCERKVQQNLDDAEELDAKYLEQFKRAQKAEARARELERELEESHLNEERNGSHRLKAIGHLQAALATERERNAKMTEAMRQVRNTAIVVLGYRVDQIIEAALAATPPGECSLIEPVERVVVEEPDACEQCGRNLRLVCDAGCT